LLTLAVPAEHGATIAHFLTRVGECVGVAFAEVDTKAGRAGSAATEVPPATESQVAGVRAIGLAEHLHRIGYFRNIHLWEALEAHGIYTQVEHKAFVERGPCYYDYGLEREIRVGACSGDVCAHHVTGAELPAAGKGKNPRKPPHWFTLPMCFGHHGYVHGKDCTRAEKEAMRVAAVAFMAERAKVMVKAYLGIESLAVLTLERLHEFEDELGLPLLVYEGRAA